MSLRGSDKQSRNQLLKWKLARFAQTFIIISCSLLYLALITLLGMLIAMNHHATRMNNAYGMISATVAKGRLYQESIQEVSRQY